MAKFCTNCGNQLLDDATVCPVCNAQVMPTPAVETPVVEQQPVAEAPVAPPVAPTYGYAPQPAYVAPTQPKKKWLKIGIAAVAVVLVIVLVSSLSGGSYKDAIKNYYAVLFDGDASKIEKLAPKEYWDEEGYDLEKLKEKWPKYHEDDYIEFFEDFYGNNVDMSYEIKDAKKMDRDVLDELAENINEKYEYIDENDVTEGYEVEVEIIIKSDNQNSTNDTTWSTVKINGNWYTVTSSGRFNTEIFEYID